MAITYNLSIGSLGRKLSLDGLENVIYEVSVGVNAQSQEYPQFTYSCGGTIQFDTSEIDDESFIPFDEVTQEVVLGWLLAKEGVDTVDEFSYVKSSVDNIQARVDALQVEDSVSVGWSVTNAPEPTLVVEETPATEDISES
jgi:hypothetical protein